MDEGPKQAAISSSWTSLTAKERSKDTAGVAERLKHENGKVTAVQQPQKITAHKHRLRNEKKLLQDPEISFNLQKSA